MTNEMIKTIKQRGRIRCGVSRGIYGMSYQEGQSWRGFDVDFGRAVAAAVLGDATKVDFISLKPEERFSALRDETVDVLCCNATCTFSRDSAQGITFAAMTVYDGETMLVHRDLGVTSVRQLKNPTVALQSGTTTDINLQRFLQQHGISFTGRYYSTPQEALDGYARRECDAYALDRVPLTGERLRLPNPEEHIIVPETFSKEPMGPAVKAGDGLWEKVVRWVIYLTIEAEDVGVSSESIDAQIADKNPDALHLLKSADAVSSHLQLEPGWAHHVIKQVGNYHEIFERNLGMKSRLKLERGMNALWSKGGILYAPPFK
ncbi:Glutamate Aspartate periplasmic binding protein precursor GltI [Cystobacter fuscus DSM 2262]|uniref:Glutamate Aspartate periplasmic binding protein GltI n=1 Tax=Cystobacter fuscus (strain ATCC 25194 / DSM 2262 / NBRC 100088 / M29) TaxID=1242864 RepID=S9PGM0_CYSF2|nr:amino acid ABC transporter substrate-binding protein [Cystobacter fuscus]EPX63500.1 Glutamate Aspartate periplasmic binding protein precursor GltI [Cystobacter fuscus DSM 2262]